MRRTSEAAASPSDLLKRAQGARGGMSGYGVQPSHNPPVVGSIPTRPTTPAPLGRCPRQDLTGPPRSCLSRLRLLASRAQLVHGRESKIPCLALEGWPSQAGCVAR
jgi:hypothetical protein